MRVQFEGFVDRESGLNECELTLLRVNYPGRGDGESVHPRTGR